ncbi:MAG: type II secretion system F family protein [Halothiobacillaceae bacterium]|nr:MAG: type II secretion system F family protein [Halothiobacillaceae bacterium]
MDSSLVILVSILAFLAVVILVEGLYLLTRSVHEEGAARVQRRLRHLSAGGAHGKDVARHILKGHELSDAPALNRLLVIVPRVHAVDRMLEQSGLDLTVTRYIGIQVLLSLAFFAAALALLHLPAILAALAGLVAGFLLPHLYVTNRQRKRREKLTEQLPDTLDFIARSLRAGNPFSASLKAVSEEMPDPIGKEFSITFDEMNYGLPMDDALRNLGERTGSEEIHYFITAVIIQRQTGGNLADVLNRIAEVMRSRARTFREINIQAAEMKLSAHVLIGLPFFVAGALSIMNPTYLLVLFAEPGGRVVIGAQLLLMLIGYLVVRRMINFRV